MQIENLEKTSPETKVCVVTFSNDVTIINGKVNEERVITGDKLNKFDDLISYAEKNQIQLHPIKENKSQF